jgi:hypothetical protein
MVVAFAGSLIGSVEPYLIKTIQLSEVKEKAPAEASASSVGLLILPGAY